MHLARVVFVFSLFFMCNKKTIKKVAKYLNCVKKKSNQSISQSEKICYNCCIALNLKKKKMTDELEVFYGFSQKLKKGKLYTTHKK